MVCLSLFGCDNARFKNSLQSDLNSIKNKALCYPLPNSVRIFPADVFFQSSTSELLDIFVDLKFVKKKELSLNNPDGSVSMGWRYWLTPNGEKYFQAWEGSFCFGDAILDKIYDSDNINIIEIGSRQTGKWLYYKYYYDNIPKWAEDKRLEKFYQGTEIINNQKLHNARATYNEIKKSYYSLGFDRSQTIKLKIN